MKLIILILRLVAAIILLQTLFFKFSGAKESIYIFSALGIEPYGRIGSGVVELIAAILILIPRTAWLGALIGFGVMIGALLSHLFVLGIVVQDDGGLLFALAVIVLFCCLALIFLNRDKYFYLVQKRY
jgi:uncharacterized membrane protein YphA (DoxX/SURF4 family)